MRSPLRQATSKSLRESPAPAGPKRSKKKSRANKASMPYSVCDFTYDGEPKSRVLLEHDAERTPQWDLQTE
jgi:hypothetical protein